MTFFKRFSQYFNKNDNTIKNGDKIKMNTCDSLNDIKNIPSVAEDFIVPACSLDRDFGYKCRICMDLGEGKEEMCAPCVCTGTIKYIHVACLKEWIKEKKSIICELCNQQYTNQWKNWALENGIIKQDTDGEKSKDIIKVVLQLCFCVYSLLLVSMVVISYTTGNLGIDINELETSEISVLYMFFLWDIQFVVTQSMSFYSQDSIRSKIERNVEDMFPHSNSSSYYNYLKLPVRNKVN